MPPYDSLPVILVSAFDDAAACSFISDLLDVDVTEEYNGAETSGRVWRIQNKYYSADVLVTHTKTTTLQELEVHAHVICLNENQCSADFADAKVFPGTHGVRLVVAQCENVPESLLSWALKFGYEVVPLLEVADVEEQQSVEELESCPFREEYGMSRVRAAFHAHVWPAPGQTYETRSSESSCGGSESEGSESGAEQFLAALEALGAARALPASQRAEHAHALLGAFCRALGHRLDCL